MTNKNTKPTFIETRNKQYARRQKKGIQGPMQMIGTAAGTIGGAFLGGPLGAGIGASLGGAIGNGIGWITGSGDYKVQQNACNVPGFRNSDSTVITHREYITDVRSGTIPGGSTATSFNVEKYPLNPGVTTTFPWLAGIASNYEEYEILGMVFAFVATSGESVASSNTSLGSVVLATEYDPTKPAFVSKQAMENYHFSSSAKPSVNQMHAIECKKILSPVKQLYVRNGANTGDLRWTDFGNFFIATVGCQAAGVNLGELWVTYKVRLSKPRLPQTIGFGGQILSQVTSRVSGTLANTLGATQILTRGSIPTGDFTITNNNTVSFKGQPMMNYLVQLYFYGAGFTTVSLNTLVNCKYLNTWTGGTAPTAVGKDGSFINLTAMLESTGLDSDDYLSFTVALGASSGHSVDILITQVDDTLA